MPPNTALLALALVAALAAPATLSIARGVQPPGGPDAYSASLDRCQDRHGKIARGPFGESYCRIDFRDGGAPCTDKSQCLGGCIYQPRSGPLRAPETPVVGACQRANVQYGCFGRVEGGYVKHMICAD